jgi:hypothetical protein
VTIHQVVKGKNHSTLIQLKIAKTRQSKKLKQPPFKARLSHSPKENVGASQEANVDFITTSVEFLRIVNDKKGAKTAKVNTW